MKTFANSTPHQCPETVLLLIGGDPDKEWEAAAFVFFRGDDYLKLGKRE